MERARWRATVVAVGLAMATAGALVPTTTAGAAAPTCTPGTPAVVGSGAGRLTITVPGCTTEACDSFDVRIIAVQSTAN